MTKEQLYKKFAKYYDKIYSKKEYKKETDFIEQVIKRYKKNKGNQLLDVGCGTGNHALLLKRNYSIVGVDINTEMLKIARKKVKGVKFVKANMKNLDLKRKFDIIICMFSTINYNTTYEELEKTLKNFYYHLQDGGIVIYDLGFNKEGWIERSTWIDTVVEKNLQLARISQTKSEDDIFNANFIFLINDKGKFNFQIDHHKLGIFEIDKVRRLMKKIGFQTYIYENYALKRLERKSMRRIQTPFKKFTPIFVGIK